MKKWLQTHAHFVALTTTLTIIALIYLRTLSVYLQEGDSGEMVIGATLLRVVHPPGYPLYIYLGHLFSLLPFGTPPWKVGLFSAVAQLAASGIFFDLIRRWLKRLDVAIIVTLFYSLSPVIWSFANTAEVFALNNFFLMAFFWLIFRYQEARDDRWAYLGVLVAGLAGSHHQLSVLLTFPVVMFFMISDRRHWFNGRRFLQATLLFVLGLTPYLLLFPLGRNPDLVSWGDFSNWQGFFDHVLRRAYGTFNFTTPGRGDTAFFFNLYHFSKETFIQCAGWGLVIPLVAIFANRKRFLQNEFLKCLGFTALFIILFIASRANIDLKFGLYYYALLRMWTVPMLLVWLLAAYGLSWAFTHFSKWQSYQWLAMGLLLTVLTGWRWQFQDRSQNDMYERMGKAVIENVAPGALVMGRGDTPVHMIRYARYVQGVRPDVQIIPLDLLSHPWAHVAVHRVLPDFKFPQDVEEYRNTPGANTFREMCLANLDRFPIYMPQLSDDEVVISQNGLVGFIYGLTIRVERPGKHWTFEEVDHEIQPFIHFKMPDVSYTPWYAWERFYRFLYFQSKIGVGASLATRAGEDIRFFDRAKEIFQMVADESPESRDVALLQIGFLYHDQASRNPEYIKPAINAWEAYLKEYPAETPDSKQARENLAQLKLYVANQSK